MNELQNPWMAWTMMMVPMLLIQFVGQVAAIVVGLTIWDRFLRR